MPVTFRRNDPLRGTTAERRISEALRDGWKPLGESLVGWLKAKSPIYKGTFQKSHKYKVRGVGLKTSLVVFSSDKLGAWKDRGRKAGRFPPPKAMLAYVRHRGLTIAGSKAKLITQQKSIAFLIGRKIARGNINSKRPNLYTRVVPENRGKIAAAIKRLSALVAQKLNRP